MNKFIFYFLFIVVSFSLSSCSFHRWVAGKKTKAVPKDTVINRLVENEQLLSSKDTANNKIAISDTNREVADTLNIKMWSTAAYLWNRRLEYETFSGKARVHFESNDINEDFNANFRVRKDSVIWITISAMGGMVQAARIFITKDSFFFVNYVQKEAICMPLAEAEKVMPSKVDFSFMQNLILGEPLRKGTINFLSAHSDSLYLEVADSAYYQYITYLKSDSTLFSGEIQTNHQNGPKAFLEYANYTTTDSRKISTERSVNVENGTEKMLLNINFINENFNNSLEFPFSIPKNYTIKNQK